MSATLRMALPSKGRLAEPARALLQSAGVGFAENGRTLHVVIVGSPNVNPGYKLVNNTTYPQIADDYRRQFQILKALPCDIFLGAHGGYFDLKEKHERLQRGDHDAFVDPAGYRAYIADREQAFESAFKKQIGK